MISCLNSYFLIHCFNRSYSQATNSRNIGRITSTLRRISSTKSSHKETNIVHGRCESDSHADTTAVGGNCIILEYTGKVCDVSPYRDDYESVKNVPIVHAGTAWQSPETGQTYIFLCSMKFFGWVILWKTLSSTPTNCAILGRKFKIIPWMIDNFGR